MEEHEIRWESKCVGFGVQTYLCITESPCSLTLFEGRRQYQPNKGLGQKWGEE